MYVRPELEVDDGADKTNTRRVDVKFSSVYGTPTEVRFAYNNSGWGDWQSYTESVKVEMHQLTS